MHSQTLPESPSLGHEVTLAAIAELLLAAQRVLVMCHINPDGDAIGSMLGLGWLLRERPDLQCTLVCADPVPPELRFLPGADTVANDVPQASYDVVCALDASDPARLGAVYRAGYFGHAPVLVLDHHITNVRFGTFNYVDTRAASTAQIVLDLGGELGAPLTAEAAVCLLTGLVTDTLGFRTSNVTANVLVAALRLVEAGASIPEITQRTLNSRPAGVLRLWGRALGQLRVEGQVAWTEVTREMRAACGIAGDDDGGLVSQIISAQEASIAVVFNELLDGRIEVDLRAKPGADVSDVALSLGGGGHRQAAGCVLPGPLSHAEAVVLGRLFGAAHPASER